MKQATKRRMQKNKLRNYTKSMNRKIVYMTKYIAPDQFLQAGEW